MLGHHVVMQLSVRSTGWWWLPALSSALCAGAMYRVAFAVEAGSRAGAEPVMAGLVIAFPFAALAVFQTLLALYVASHPPGRGLAAARWVSSGAALIVAGLVVYTATSIAAQGYLSPSLVGQASLLVGALLLPLAPIWVAAAPPRPRNQPPGTDTGSTSHPDAGLWHSP